MTEAPPISKWSALTFAAVVFGLGGAVLCAPLMDRLTPGKTVTRGVVAPAGHGPAATGSLAGFFPLGVWVPPAADFA